MLEEASADPINEVLDYEQASLDPFYQEAWSRMQKLRRLAHELCDDYWFEHHRMRREAQKRWERPLFGCKVREGKIKITPIWFVYKFSNNGKHAFPQVLKPTSYLPARYSMAVFQTAPRSEYELIARIEEQFIPIRGHAEVMSRLFAMLRANEVRALQIAGRTEAEVKEIQRDRDRRMVMFTSTEERARSSAARRGKL